MKRLSGRPKTASNFSQSVHQQLNMYTIAAGAAGVGVLAFAQPIEAKIVYTPAKVQIGGDYRYNLDLNNDGITDFTIAHHTFLYFVRHSSLYTIPVTSNGAVGTTWASAVDRGAKIGPGQAFVGRQANMVNQECVGGPRCWHQGPWWDVTNRYLGLKFKINGKTHYGWARLSVANDKTVGTLTGYAYETIPGKSIIAGRTKGPADESDEKDFGPGASLTAPIPNSPEADRHCRLGRSQVRCCFVATVRLMGRPGQD